jgi:hypothetical protein
VLVLDGKTLVYDRPFSHDGINYPANWLRLTTLAEKEAIGITEVSNPVTPSYDQRFYWGVGNPKDLDELKSLWVVTTKERANSLLQPSDWYAIRKADTGEAIPTAWSDWRQSIRVAAAAKITMIELQTTVDSLASYITTTTTSESSPAGIASDYPVWPADPNQPVVEASDEEDSVVETPVDEISSGGFTSAGIVSGGITDSAGEDVISF